MGKSLGIDIRDEFVALTLLSKKMRSMEILGSHFFRTFPARGQKALEQIMINEISNFMVGLKTPPHSVVLSLPRRLVTIQTFELPAPSRKELDSMVEFELERHFSSNRETLNISYHVAEKSDNNYQIVAAAIKKETLKQYTEILSQLELKPDIVDVSTFSNLNIVINILLNDPDFSNHYYDESPSDVAFKTLSEGFSRLIVESLQSTLYSCANINSEENIEKIHLFGGGNYQRPLAQQLEKNTGVFTETTLPTFMMKRDLPTQFDPSFQLSSLGLAQRALRKNPFELNLRPTLPGDKGTTKSAFRKTFVLCFIAALAVIGLITGQAATNNRTLHSLETQLKEVKAQVGTLEQVDREFSKLQSYVEALNSIDQKTPLKIPLLQDLTRRLPPDTWLTRINIQKGKIEIQGFSSSASKLISVIESSPYFQNTAFNGSVVKEIRGERFKITSYLEGPKP
jgi:Tfp pilus assembly PilM family ATPase